MSHYCVRAANRIELTLASPALLGESDVLAGQVVCPRSSPDAITLPNIQWDSLLTESNWIQPSRTAFVPQSAWLQNASVRQIMPRTYGHNLTLILSRSAPTSASDCRELGQCAFPITRLMNFGLAQLSQGSLHCYARGL